MSRWLKSVNTLLENLDDTVGEAIEEREAERLYAEEEAAQVAAATTGSLHGDAETGAEGLAAATVGARSAVDDVLAKRGLLDDEEEEGAEGDGNVAAEEIPSGEGRLDDDHDEEEVVVVSSIGDEDSAPQKPLFESSTHGATADGEGHGDDDGEKVAPFASEGSAEGGQNSTEASVGDSHHASTAKDVEAAPPEATEGEGEVTSPTGAVDVPRSGSTPPDAAVAEPVPVPPPPTSEGSAVAAEGGGKSSSGPPRSGNAPPPPGNVAAANAASAAANKEVRKLRRHVLKLNADLESTEREMEAQRSELERAAARMERDRARHKEERERDRTERKAEIDALAAEHAANLDALSKRHEESLEAMRSRAERAEEARAREGGEWDVELAESVKREQESNRRCAALEDERSTLLSQISTLQAQMDALSSRLETALENSEASTEREREAEDRLDKALTLHARQLGQRQARESELERTVADLGAALVVARQREQQGRTAAAGFETSANQSNGGAGKNNSRDVREKLKVAEDELETTKAQLSLERQRCQTLHQELQDMSKEQTEEASAAHARQRQYDRQIADLTSTVARLKAELKKAKDSTESNDPYAAGNAGTSAHLREEELKNQLSSLSEKIVRQQAKIDSSKGETATLKSRLRTALNRAETAEAALEIAQNRPDDYDVEKAPLSGGVHPGTASKMRRRGGRRAGQKSVSSIRSAMRLDQGRVEGGKEQLGQVIDAVDQWSVETGAYLRHNPIARAAFLAYLAVLHLWAFCLVLFHAHSYESDHGDSHGPHALLQHSYRHMEQLPRNP